MVTIGAPLIGRDPVLGDLVERLDRGVAVVSVVGPPGVGKTAVARTLAGARPSAWCACDQVTRPSGVQRLLGALLGVPLLDCAGDAPSDALGWALASAGPLLVVLDGVDPVATQLRELLARWVELAPEARFLLTSRRRPAVGDDVVELPALDAAAAEALFRARAGELASGTDLPDLGGLVARLDGLPLAIELAAARVRVLSLGSLKSRLSLDLLRDDQRSLRGAIAGSWQPLGPALRDAMSWCAVFPGAFALEDVEAVAEVVEPPVLTRIEGLLDRSLLAWAPGPDGPRFSLLRSVRSFVLELAPPGAETTARFRRRTLDRAQEAAALLHGLSARQAVASLQSLVGALEAVVEGGDSSERVEAILALGALAEISGPLGPHLDRLERALAEPLPPAARAALVVAACDALRVSREHQRAGTLLAGLDELIDALASEPPDSRAAAEAELRCAAGTNLVDRYELAAGIAALQEAVSGFVALDHPTGEAKALRRLATAALFQGELDVAASHLARALALARGAENLRLEALVLSSLGLTERHRVAPIQSEAFFRQALRLYGVTGDRSLEASITGFLALTLWDQCRLPEARDAFVLSAELCQQVGDPAGRAGALGALAAVLIEQGAADDALDGLTRELSQRSLRARDRALLTAHCGVALHALGQREDAVVRYQQAVPSLEHAAARSQASTVRAFWALACTDAGEAGQLLEAAAATAPNTDEHRLLVAVAREVVERGFVEPERRQQVADSARGYARLLLHLADHQWGAARVAGDGAWFETPGSGRVELGRRRVLRRLLKVLADQHAAQPGAALTLARLFEAAWPGERAVGGSADARVYVGISTLRKLGLGDALVTRSLPEGTAYALHATVSLGD